MGHNWEKKLTFYTNRSRAIICNHVTAQIVDMDLLMTFR